MKLLLRANSHRHVDGVLEIASSPDTPRREPWQWHLRTAPAGAPAAADTLSAPLGERGQLQLTIDPAVVRADVATVGLGNPLRVRRSTDELVMLVVGGGSVLLEKGHLLGELDTVVIAGDDPLEITVTQASAECASLVVIRLNSVARGGVTWVP